MTRRTTATQYRRVGIVSTFEEACYTLSVLPEMRAKRNPRGFHYLRAEGKGKGTARVQFHNPERTKGVVINLTTGEYCLFFPKSERRLSRSEIEAERVRTEQWLRITAEETERRHRATAEKARRILEASRPADGNPYLVRKQVRAVDTLRQITAQDFYALDLFGAWHPYPDDSELLLVPVQFNGETVNLQLIPERGTKLSLPDGKLGGGCLWLSEELPEYSEEKMSIGIAEGVATMLTVMESFAESDVRIFGACSFGCSNLSASAVRLRERFPEAVVFVFGDLGNGSESARDASEALCGDRDRLVRFPEFTEEEVAWHTARNGKPPTDFNDKKTIILGMREKK